MTYDTTYDDYELDNNDNMSVTSNCTYISSTAKQLATLQRSDPYYIETFVSRKRKNTKNNRKKYKNMFYKHKISCYANNPNSKKIRCALTGALFDGKVGTYQEDMYFKVIDTSIGSIPYVFYYDNPESYERHCFREVSDDIRVKWEQKKNDAMRKYQNENK